MRLGFIILLLFIATQALAEVDMTQKAKEIAAQAMTNYKASDSKTIKKALKRAQKRLKELEPEQLHNINMDRKFAGKSYTMAISASIPADFLKTYIRQALKENINLRFILRGFVEGIKEIKPTIGFYINIALKPEKSLTDPDSLYPVAMDIDPIKFGRIEKVPALIKDECVVYGDAKLTALIEKAEQRLCNTVIGATYPVIEQNALQEIQKRAENIPESFFKGLVVQKEKELQNLPGANLLPPASSDSTKVISINYKLPFDVPDPNTGEVMYPAGYSYNPLEYLTPFSIEMLLINGTRESEVTWAKKILTEKKFTHRIKIGVLGGNYFELTEKLGRPVFSGVDLASYCPATPCLIKKGKGENVLTIQTWRIAN